MVHKQKYFCVFFIFLVIAQNPQLVVSTRLKNISRNGNLPQIGLKIKHIWNHHPENPDNDWTSETLLQPTFPFCFYPCGSLETAQKNLQKIPTVWVNRRPSPQINQPMVASRGSRAKDPDKRIQSAQIHGNLMGCNRRLRSVASISSPILWVKLILFHQCGHLGKMIFQQCNKPPWKLLMWSYSHSLRLALNQEQWQLPGCSFIGDFPKFPLAMASLTHLQLTLTDSARKHSPIHCWTLLESRVNGKRLKKWNLECIN